MDHGPRTEVMRVRVTPELKAALPVQKGKQSAFIRKAVKHFLETQQGALRIPIPREAELQTMQWLLVEMNKIGVNLNQAVMLLHLAEQGRDLPPSAEEIRILHRQIVAYSKRLEGIIRYWRCG